MKQFHIDSDHEKKLKIIEIDNDYSIDKNLEIKLNITKQKINKYENKWNIYKKSLNLYEYIYTSSSNKNKNIGDILPISRSFFKIHEILMDFDILKNLDNITITCIAEAPGGFIENILYNCKKKKINIKNIYGISLKKKKSPYWNINILLNEFINIIYGEDNTGDICKLNNINNFIDNIGKHVCDIVTSDGGIDYSLNYNNQEKDSYRFIYSEILLALSIQKPGGTFILKIFDILNHNTIQLIYLLYLCYENIYISKPQTSRNTNSEKYIVCINYKIQKDIINILKLNYNQDINIYIPDIFIQNINLYNSIYINKQINNIKKVLNNIEKNILYQFPSNKQIYESIKWCYKYNIPINKNCIFNLNK